MGDAVIIGALSVALGACLKMAWEMDKPLPPDRKNLSGVKVWSRAGVVSL